MTNNQITNLENILEALLFTYGEAISLKKLAEVTKRSRADLTLALDNLKTSLSGRGIRLMNKDDRWQLVADKSAAEFVANLVKSEIQEELTQAGLEVMAIVAYRGPVSKNQIETIRGVNSTYALRNLVLRGLVEKNETAKPQTYEISLSALRKLGVEKVEELPRYRELKQEVENIEKLIEPA